MEHVCCAFDSLLESILDWKIRGRRRTGDVCMPVAVNGDTIALLDERPTQIRRVDQRVSIHVEFRNEYIQCAFWTSLEGVLGGKVRGKCFPGYKSVTVMINCDGTPYVTPRAA